MKGSEKPHRKRSYEATKSQILSWLTSQYPILAERLAWLESLYNFSMETLEMFTLKPQNQSSIANAMEAAENM